MKRLNYAPFALLLLLSGCAALGILTPKTFNERAAFAHETVNGVVTATTNALDAQAIHSSDAEWVSDAAKRTLTLLGSAEAAANSGDPATAEGRLALAEGILKELQRYLAARGVKS